MKSNWNSANEGKQVRLTPRYQNEHWLVHNCKQSFYLFYNEGKSFANCVYLNDQNHKGFSIVIS